MSNASSKTIGIILIVVFIILLGTAGLRWFGWPFRTHNYFFPMTFSLLSLLWLLLAVWVYKDAESRGMNGLLWALLVFIGNLIGLIIFLIVRNERKPSAPAAGAAAAKTACPSCGQDVTANFKFCPNCGKSVQAVCPACGKPAESAWKACPYCGQKFGGVAGCCSPESK